VRVVLWGLPPTFCALVQEAGRAGRNLDTEAEAILIVPQSVMHENIENLNDTVTDLPDAEDLIEDVGLDSDEEVPVADTFQAQERHEKTAATKEPIRRKAFNKETNIREVRALYAFAQTALCRRIPWDEFFKNAKKRKHY
jgi:ATP-dependent helicase YprA (DUF1998 family)